MSPIVLSDEVLDGLQARADHALIPCLQFVVKAPGQKPCCGRRAPVETRVHGEQARICVSQLPPERLEVLKRALGAERIILYISTPGFPRRTVI